MEPSLPPATTSGDAPLFPLFPLSSSTQAATSTTSTDWLSNPSFTLDVSALPPPPSSSSLPPDTSDNEDDAPSQAPRYDILPDSDPEETRISRSRKRKKRRGTDRDVDDGGIARKSGVRAWAGSYSAPPGKDYYFDSTGDPDNLAFGSLYRMDVARYKPLNLTHSDEQYFHLVDCWRDSAAGVGDDADVDRVDGNARAGGRYFSAKYAAVEYDKGIKHSKITKNLIPFGENEEFVSFEDPSHENHGHAPMEIEESWEDEMIRKTREFNRMSRESPYDEKMWLAFAKFQDNIASSQAKKSARLQILERKISILEKAVELNPNKEELLLFLLSSYRDRDNSELILKKWQNKLAQHSDSLMLWKEYLLLCQSEFSQFKVSEMRKKYSFAIQALSAACSKNSRQDSHSLSLAERELGIVDVFVSLCRFEWQTGYRELATGLFQAQIEYCLFCPTLQLTENSKLRLFEHFWNGGAARIGEDGAFGWSTWLAKDEENAQSRHGSLIQESSENVQPGGWTGWFNPSLENAGNQENEPQINRATSNGNDAENMDVDAIQTEEDIESLLKKLGVDIDAESNSEVKDTETWRRWSMEELSRDNEQWIPVRESTASAHSDDALVQEDQGQLSRVIVFQDVAEYVFSLSSEEARLSLLCQFLDFYGGKIFQRVSTNSSTWLDKILSLEIVPDSIMEDLIPTADFKSNKDGDWMNFGLLLDVKGNVSSINSMTKFLRNAILLCLSIFPRNQMLEEALLLTEETDTEGGRLLNNTSRSLAKSLLKKYRQDFILCGVYARSEASCGNIEQARKIFDMALLSVEGASKDQEEHVALIYFWYADMEMGLSNVDNSSDSLHRAIYILSCLGGKCKYAPFSFPASGPQLLIARQGFKERIRALRPLISTGTLKAHSVAFICSAALFEALTSGCSAGLAVLEDSFTMSLPERRTKSCELESIWGYYIELVLKHLNQLRFSRVWSTVDQGIRIYPYNPKSYAALLSLCCSYSVSSRVRLELDKCFQRNPSVIACLSALCFEWKRPGTEHRIHGLFEKALADEKLQRSILLWRCYLAYEANVACNPNAAKRVFFRAIHACPWSKRLWLDGFQKLSSILTVKELSDLQEVMRDKELNIRTDIYEILLQDDMGCDG